MIITKKKKNLIKYIIYNTMKYTLKFLQFYKEFFEEEGLEWTLQEVKQKLIEDNIKEYKLN